MIPGPDAQRTRVQLLIWWLVWGGVLLGLVFSYFVLGRAPLKASPAGTHPLTGLVGLVPLFVSIIIRWLAVPRFNELSRAFPWFIVGLGLAEACGLLGIFLGGVYRDDLFLLGVLGIMQYVPFFARQYLVPKPTGFIPNN